MDVRRRDLLLLLVRVTALYSVVCFCNGELPVVPASAAEQNRAESTLVVGVVVRDKIRQRLVD